MTANARRVIGRILSLGFPLPGVQVDNYNFLSAPSFFDYDALVVDVAALSALIEGVIAGETEAATFAGTPIRNAEPSPGTESLADVLHRRRDEASMLLANGGVVICFAHPSTVHAGIVGCGGDLQTCFWLPSPPAVIAADGAQSQIIDFQHPLAAFVHGEAANIAYRARFDGIDPAHVFARSHGGVAIGIEVPRDAGRVIFLPAMRAIPNGDARYAMSDALQSGIRRALGVMAEGRPPTWLSSHPVPGLSTLDADVARARGVLEDAQRGLVDAEAAHEDLAKYHRLLWQEGALGLDGVVLDALRLLGCEVYASNANELEMKIGETSVLFEIEASEHPIDLAPHHRLRQRIERAIERRGMALRGVLLVNGQLLQSPGERSRQVSDALALAAETMRYCIAPTSTLFDAVVAHLSGDGDAVEAYLAAIASHDGVLATPVRDRGAALA